MGIFKAQNTFTGGVISPRLFGRVDLPIYRNSVSEMENFLVLPHGGAQTRSGTRFLRKVDDSTKTTRLIAFESSRDEGYCLEFGDKYVLPYLRGVAANTPYRGTWGAGITYAINNIVKDPGSVTYYKSLANGNIGNDPTVTSIQVVNKDPISDSTFLGNWSGTPGSRYTLVDDFPDAPDAVDYLTTNGVSGTDRALFNYSALSVPASATDIKVKVEFYAKRISGSSLATVAPWVVVNSIVSAETPPVGIGNTYTLYSWEMTDNPQTSAPWTPDDVNGTSAAPLERFGLGVNWSGITTTTVAVSGVRMTVTYTPAVLKWENVGSTLPAGTSKITTPYAHTDLAHLRYCQSIDVMYLFHPSYPVYRLTRNSAGTWALTTEAFLAGPWENLNFTTTTMVSSAATGSVTVTASATTGINGGQGFLPSDVGRLVRLYNSGWKWGQITAVLTDKTATVTVVQGNFPLVATTQWQMGAYSATTGYPELGGLFEGRLALAGGERVDLSKTDAFVDFGVSDPLVASDACGFKALSNEANEIRWLTASRGGLAVGTSGGEWLLNGGGREVPLSATSVGYRRHTTVGGLALPAVQADEAVLFAKRNGHSVHEFAFTFEKDAFVSPDLTLLAEHLFRVESIVAWDYQRANDVLWVVRSDGKVCSLTYRRADQVVAWSTHDFGGDVLDVACVNEGDADVPYFIVRRTIDGADVQYVEALEPLFNSTSMADAWMMDCAMEYSGAGFTTVSGLDHLEGETVTGLADGMVIGNHVVTGGKITIPFAANYAIVGLPTMAKIESLPIEEAALEDGATIGRIKLVGRMGVRVSDSYGASMGPDEDHLDEVTFNENLVFGAAPVPFTGEKLMFIEAFHGTDRRVVVKRVSPFPLTVNALVVEWEVTQR